MKEFDEQQQARPVGSGTWAVAPVSSGWVFGGFWLLLLLGTVLVGGPWVGFHGLLLGGAGCMMAVWRPVVALPRLWWVLAGGFVIAGAAPFLPAAWFAMPEWRGRLTALGIPTGTMVTMQPQQTAEMLALFAFTLVTGLWLAGHRATAAQLRCWTLAFTLGVAGYAILAKILQRPPDSGISGGEVGFGFFPNRNHTSTYLAMGVIAGLGSVFQAMRDKRWLALAAGLLGTSICLWAVAAWSISRGGLVLVAGGGLAWLLLVGTRHFGQQRGRWAVALLALGVVTWFGTVDSTAKKRLATTMGRVGAVMTVGEASAQAGPPSVDPVVELDYRIPVMLDALQLVRDFRWTGIGAGQFSYIFPQYRQLTITRNDSDCFHPDNDWLWLLAETGPLAVLALVVLVCLACRAALRGILRGRDRALRSACLVAALVVPLHGLFDVPGHRLTLAWSAAFLFCLSLPPPTDRQPWHVVASWPSRLLALAMLAAAAFLVRAQWWGGRSPAYAAAQLAVDQAMALYQEDLALQNAALKRGLRYQPEATADLLEKALGVLDCAAKRVPLDREIPHVRGLLALQFDDKLELAEQAFAAERALDPSWVFGPLHQAAALGTVRPARAVELWQEALRRAERVDRVKPGTVWGKEYTIVRIRRSVKGKPTLEALVPQVE